MSNQTRSEMLWRLFGDKHPKFCVRYYALSRGADILHLPEEQPLSPDAAAAKVFFEELDALSDDALAERVAEADREKAAAEEAAHPLNQPDCFASDEVNNYWCKAAYWEADEAAALLLERHPDRLNSETLKHQRRPSNIAYEYGALKELLLRAVRTKQIGYKSAPGVFLAWAKRNHIEVPGRLETAVRAHGHQVADWKSLYDEANKTAMENKAIAEAGQARAAMLEEQLEKQAQTYKEMLETAAAQYEEQAAQWAAALDEAQKANNLDKPLTTRERETLLTIVLGMAVGGYGYQPRGARSSTAREISDDVTKAGLSVSDDTIRKYLREATELAPPVETE